VTGRVTRIVRVGFEVRVEVTTDDQVVTVTLPRSEFLELGLRTDAVVWVHEAAPARLTAGTP
jgi:sulfate transport system ATP-binding protein